MAAKWLVACASDEAVPGVLFGPETPVSHDAQNERSAPLLLHVWLVGQAGTGLEPAPHLRGACRGVPK